MSSGIMEDCFLPMMTAGTAALPMTANGLVSPSLAALDEEEPRLWGGGCCGCCGILFPLCRFGCDAN